MLCPVLSLLVLLDVPPVEHGLERTAPSVQAVRLAEGPPRARSRPACRAARRSCWTAASTRRPGPRPRPRHGFKQREPQGRRPRHRRHRGAPALRRQEPLHRHPRPRRRAGPGHRPDPGARPPASRPTRAATASAGDDAVLLLLDPFLDRRNAFVFGTNPNGAEHDALIADERESFNTDWRGVWRVAAQRVGGGLVGGVRHPVPLPALPARRARLGLQRLPDAAPQERGVARGPAGRAATAASTG